MVLSVVFAAFLLFFSQLVCADETTALLKLWNETNGPGWSSTCLPSSWLASRDHCQFFGVVCDSSGHVIGLLLSNCNLNGGLTDEVFTSLPMLQQVFFGVNKLVGSVPLSLFGSPLLTLQIEENGFVGPLPADLSVLSPSLTVLNVAHNQLSGKIPKLPLSLQSLFLQNNGFTSGLANAANLTRLVYLRVHNNLLAESIPQFVTPSLVEFHVSNNSLFGTIHFDSFAAMENISVIDVTVNKLMGNLPTQASSLPRVHVFRAGFNLLSGPVVTRAFNAVGQTLLLDVKFNPHLSFSFAGISPTGQFRNAGIMSFDVTGCDVALGESLSFTLLLLL
jgi:hypothetical protein